MPDSVPDAMTTTVDHPSNSGQEHYTGVVVIHGLGAIKRNTTLEEAVNTLAYWFNHEAGLSLRREGSGRVWVTSQLTDDPNPDAAPARATLSIVAPGKSVGSGVDTDEHLRLEFREVWWAESFGVPSVGATFAWARVQAVEQATHLLLPIGRRLGPAQTARRAPARQIPQALTYRPPVEAAQTPMTPQPGSLPVEEADATTGAHVHFTRLQRRLLTGALGVYGLVQYVWKALQWLVLTPLILLLLLVMSLIRVLVAVIPPLQSSAIAAVSAVLDTVMLHWIAEAQVYTLDYTRSAGIRERFEREVIDFLRDESCDRIVVLAHSMGTVIAYEGLTTIFELPEFTGGTKPVTFICLAQALRRVWLMTADDPHRLRGVLPNRVRWLHFWGRYDPVTAGPLSSHALPRLDAWPDLEMPDPDEALAARLDFCENVDVVNTDSAFTDHTTYWQNLEQVVGPVARELVEGHAVLERVVKAHLAAPDDVLLRRWRVAWRAVLALVVGFGVGLALLLWDGSQGWSRVGQTLGMSFLQFVGDLLGAVASGFGAVFADLQHILAGLSGGQAPSLPVSITIPDSIAFAIWSILASLVVAGVSILVIGQGIALRPPLSLAGRGPARWRRALSLFLLSAVFLEVVAVYGQLSDVLGIPKLVSAVIVNAGLFCGLAAFIVALVVAAQRGQWGWEAAMLLLTGPYALLLANYFLSTPLPWLPTPIEYEFAIAPAAAAGAVVVAVGGLLYLVALARSRRLGSFIVLLLIELPLVYTSLAFQGSPPLWVVNIFMPMFAYALVTWARPLGIRPAVPDGNNSLISLPIAALILLNVIVLVLSPSLAASYVSGISTSCPAGNCIFAPAALAPTVFMLAYSVIFLSCPGLPVPLSLLAVVRASIHAIQTRRWIWLVAILVVMLAMLSVMSLPVGFAAAVREYFNTNFDLTSFTGSDGSGQLGLVPFLYVCCVFAGPAALAYGLWGGLTLGKSDKLEARSRDRSKTPMQ